ncbi:MULTISPECIES: hypothetical protein [unclassified Stygiolobus]|uniref:hypothetical protein n=1 Tax=unclassified Stygiolobus TaxID=2824672 RepID=UPI00307D4A2C
MIFPSALFIVSLLNFLPKLQFKNVTDNQKLAIISGMTLGGLMIIYQGQSLFMPVKLTAYEVK